MPGFIVTSKLPKLEDKNSTLVLLRPVFDYDKKDLLAVMRHIETEISEELVLYQSEPTSYPVAAFYPNDLIAGVHLQLKDFIQKLDAFESDKIPLSYLTTLRSSQSYRDALVEANLNYGNFKVLLSTWRMDAGFGIYTPMPSKPFPLDVTSFSLDSKPKLLSPSKLQQSLEERVSSTPSPHSEIRLKKAKPVRRPEQPKKYQSTPGPRPAADELNDRAATNPSPEEDNSDDEELALTLLDDEMRLPLFTSSLQAPAPTLLHALGETKSTSSMQAGLFSASPSRRFSLEKSQLFIQNQSPWSAWITLIDNALLNLYSDEIRTYRSVISKGEFTNAEDKLLCYINEAKKAVKPQNKFKRFMCCSTANKVESMDAARLAEINIIRLIADLDLKDLIKKHGKSDSAYHFVSVSVETLTRKKQFEAALQTIRITLQLNAANGLLVR